MSVIWGMPYLFIKVADGGVSVPVLVFTRLAVAAALLLPLAIRRRQIAGLWRPWRWAGGFPPPRRIFSRGAPPTPRGALSGRLTRPPPPPWPITAAVSAPGAAA